ncbi:MAG: peptidase T [Firmicutes bacterium]|uniref:Peptidase T n=1 Tax=Candidatus Alloenteromonas pullistercoris TaxID=2840785 RepID=A0A9D9DFB2_9FIRM|nr:peptidase T [Candidatus Enteromonas pullistercoris]
MDKNLARFIEYVKIDTQSDPASATTPSTSKQLNLSRLLLKQLQELGLEAYIDEYGIVYGKLEGEGDPIGLNSHVDTATELSGKNVNPRIIENYDGKTIELGEGYSMSPKEFPVLLSHVGDTLVVTDGKTLLGADDKAGLAIIMAVLDFYCSHKEIKHHPICVCFTPDEEIGRGPDHFDARKFGAKFAYTVDGGDPLEIAYETFNAASAEVLIKGKAIHPGEAKNKMVNACTCAFKFDRLLPTTKRPEYTEGREGFNHLNAIEGNVAEARLHYIIRNHDRKKLEEQKKEFMAAAKECMERFPGCEVSVSIKDEYRNMKEVLDEHPEAIEKATKAFKKLGLTPSYPPIRGGTDGATFSFKGCPTPNLGTGSYNHHGRYEFLSVSEFNLMIEIVKEILKAE